MNLFSKFILAIIVILVISYFAGNYILTNLSNKYLVEVRAQLEAKGLFFEEFSFEDITLRSFRSASINEVDITFRLDQEIYGGKSFHSSFKAESVILTLESLSDLLFTFSINDFSLFVEPAEPSRRQTFGKFEEASFSSDLPLDMRSPEASAKLILIQVENLFSQNKAVGLSLSGIARVTIDQEEVAMRVRTVELGDSVQLRFNKNDIIKTADLFNVELTDQEAEVIDTHTSKVPVMIRLTRDATRKSIAYRKADRLFPEDAFRHVYWSYHLARQLGPDLAKQITDAHETASGNTAKERKMDYHNNAVGRKLANTDLSENQLRRLVLDSEEVIRRPNQITE